MAAIAGTAAPMVLLLLLIATTIVSDTAQYYGGRPWAGGRSRRGSARRRRWKAPSRGARRRPGAADGGAWSLPGQPVWLLWLVGLGLVGLGIVGDLFESLLKRSVGVKDASALIPGHGGMLDRIDSLLFAAPFYYGFLQVLGVAAAVKRIAILGSTGSIGRSALAVVDAHPERLSVTGLAAGRNSALFAEQVERMRPRAISMATERRCTR